MTGQEPGVPGKEPVDIRVSGKSFEAVTADALDVVFPERAARPAPSRPVLLTCGHYARTGAPVETRIDCEVCEAPRTIVSDAAE